MKKIEKLFVQEDFFSLELEVGENVETCEDFFCEGKAGKLRRTLDFLVYYCCCAYLH